MNIKAIIFDEMLNEQLHLQYKLGSKRGKKLKVKSIFLKVMKKVIKTPPLLKQNFLPFMQNSSKVNKTSNLLQILVYLTTLNRINTSPVTLVTNICEGQHTQKNSDWNFGLP